MTWVGSLCRGWQRRRNWGRSSDGTKGTGRTNGTRGTEGVSSAKHGAQTQTCTQEGRKVRREEGPYRFPKAGRYTPTAAEIFSPLVLLFPYRACFFGIRFSLPITTLWERGRKRVGGCCGSERSELKFEIVQKKLYNHEFARSVPYGENTLLRLWEVNLNAYVQIRNFNEWET